MTEEDLEAQIDDLRTSLTGAYRQISLLKDRVEDLEAENEELRTELELLRQDAGETRPEVTHEH